MDDSFTLRRRRVLRQIIGDGLKLYTNKSVLAMLLVLALPGFGLNMLLLAAALRTSGFTEFILTFPLATVAGALLGSGAVYALDQRDKGNQIQPGAALIVALGRAGDLVEATIRAFVSFLLFGITIIGIPWAIHRFFRWYFTTQTIMLEGESGETSLEASAGLVAGRGWPTAGLIIASSAVTGIPLLVAGFVLDSAASEATSRTIGALLGVADFPYTTATTLMIYYDLKLRKQPSTIPRYSSEDPPTTDQQ